MPGSCCCHRHGRLQWGLHFMNFWTKEVSWGLTWRGHACSDFTLKEHDVNRKGKYCKHFGLCFLPLYLQTVVGRVAGGLVDYPLGKPETVPTPPRIPMPPLPPMAATSSSQLFLSVSFLSTVLAGLQRHRALDLDISTGMVSGNAASPGLGVLGAVRRANWSHWAMPQLLCAICYGSLLS